MRNKRALDMKFEHGTEFYIFYKFEQELEVVAIKLPILGFLEKNLAGFLQF